MSTAPRVANTPSTVITPASARSNQMPKTNARRTQTNPISPRREIAAPCNGCASQIAE